MFENITKFFKKFNKKEDKTLANSKNAAKERLHLVLMQDRANVSADFLELMKQEIIEVIKKYIDVDESAIDVRLTNKENADGTNGAPALYANIPIVNIKNEARKIEKKEDKQIEKNSETEKIEETQKNKEIKIEKEEKQKTIESASDKKEEKRNSEEDDEQEEINEINDDIDENNKSKTVKNRKKQEKTKEKVKSEN